MSVRSNRAAIMTAARRGALRGVTIGAHAVHEEATSLILDTPKSGRIYRRRGVEHQASAPGEPFSSDTGATVQSGKVDLKPDELAASVNWSTAQAEHLEYGSENVAARSFARPALAAKADEVTRTIGNEVFREVISDIVGRRTS